MNKSILIVDDSKFSRTMLLRPLLNAGYQVTGCASPVEAMELILYALLRDKAKHLRLCQVSIGCNRRLTLAKPPPELGGRLIEKPVLRGMIFI